jgi:hypothetical protein
MKINLSPFLILLTLFTLSSCATKNFYQVLKTSTTNGKITETEVLFENKHCVISYDLMNTGGNPGFYFYNKTNDIITIELDKTFFIRNGESFPYFKNRVTSYSNARTALAPVVSVVYSNSISNPIEIGSAASARVETNYPQMQQMSIPPRTKMRVQEYLITNSQYQDCAYEVYPKKKEVKTLKFTAEDSPLSFSNFITYTAGGETISYETQFFVEEITNYPSGQAIIVVKKDDCGNALPNPLVQMRFSGPNYFFLPYSKDAK